jgi:hypothetical protein
MRADTPSLLVASTSVLVAPTSLLALALALVIAYPALAHGQSEVEASVAPSADLQGSPFPSPAIDPYPNRPECASMFLKADWKLTSRQRTCDWIQNRMFSMTALAGALWSAEVSMLRDAESEEGDSFSTRFARKYTQHIAKSAGNYVGGLLFHEDPRARPPYLVMKSGRRPRGFFPRVAHALGTNLISYRCDGAAGIRSGQADCTQPEHIRKVPAISRVAGAFASGAAAELWDAPENFSGNRALRGAASAYAGTMMNAVFTEFSPELNAIAGKTFRALFGGR